MNNLTQRPTLINKIFNSTLCEQLTIIMEYYIVTVIFLSISTIIFLSNFFSKSKQLPPGPKPWPIIGHIHKLGDKPHSTVAKLSKTYGPIITLKLGSKTTIVISSPEVAKEMFLNHDLALSSRAIPDAARAERHDKLSMAWLPVSPKWRNLRKIATVQLFTSQKLDASQIIRQKKVNELVDYVRQCGESGMLVDIGNVAFITTLNLLSNTFFSKDLASYSHVISSKSQEFKDLVRSVMEEDARPNVSDFFPLVRTFDLQGVRRRASKTYKRMKQIYEEIIDERLKSPMDDAKDDVLGTLLELANDGELSLDEVKHMLIDLFTAGTDTSTGTIEWAMTELLRNPEKMEKAQIEMNKVLGKDESMQEMHIKKLPYIQAIVKETMRLHPPGPFLMPHCAIKDVQLCGYLVPKHSSVWVNVWSIGRDPSVWPNPELFSPERFLEREIDIKGRDFELIPFGSGRRICPGVALADRMVHLMLATFLHSFNWKSPKAIDVEEKFGLALQKAEPLQAIPLPR